MGPFDAFQHRLVTQIKPIIAGESLDDNIELVVGNESCDLDSAISALSYAYFLQQEATITSRDALFIPVLQVKRDDFPLKTEVVHVLQQHAISQDCFLFVDEVPRPRSPIYLHLVDHNAATGPFLDSSRFRLSSIVDHHMLEHSEVTEADLRSSLTRYTREIVGSCSTLVAQLLLTQPNALSLRLARTLRATILCDTVALSLHSGNTTQHDIQAVERLEQQFNITDGREAILNDIQKAKCNINSLTCQQILLKDMKTVVAKNQKLIISSCPISLQEFCSRGDSNSSYSSVLSHTQSSFLAAKFRNQHLLLYTPSKSEFFNQIVSRLECDESLRLKLCLGASGLNLPEVHQVFSLTDPKITRKQIKPVLQEILDTLPSQSPDISRLRVDSTNDMTFQLELSGNNTPAHYGSPSHLSRDNSGFQTPVSPMSSAPNTVPPNSFMDASTLNQAILDLPSFNNVEMVNRIMLKKKMMGSSGGSPGGVSHRQEVGVTYRQEVGRASSASVEEHVDPNSVPFTPVNSFVESYWDQKGDQQHFLPSFKNKEMVTRILSGRHHPKDVEDPDADSEPDDDVDDDNMKSAELFTPHNSVCGSFVNSAGIFSKLSTNQLLLNQEELQQKLSQVEDISQSEEFSSEIYQSDTLAARAAAQRVVNDAMNSALDRLDELL